MGSILLCGMRVANHRQNELRGTVDQIPVIENQVVDSLENEVFGIAEGDSIERASVICRYWFRTIMHPDRILYDDLMDVVLKYYFVSFEWDPGHTRDPLLDSMDHGEIAFSNEGETFIKTSFDGHYSSVRSKNVLSADSISSARWEMQLTESHYHHALRSTRQHSLFMGFIDADKISSFNRGEVIGKKPHEAVLWIMEKRAPERFSNSMWRKLQHNTPIVISNRETFRLDFDFRKRECTAFHNDQYLGCISTDLPQCIYLAATVMYGGISYETTLLEINQ